jgi:hypothetical protein
VTNPGYNKITENQYSLTNPTAGGPAPGASGGPESEELLPAGRLRRGPLLLARRHQLLRGTPLAINTISGALAPSGTPIKVITAQANRASQPAPRSAASATYRPDAIPPFSLSPTSSGTNDTANGGNEPFKTIPGGAYYNDRVITDTSIFNFYKKLLDGPNKHEWKNWQPSTSR